MVAASEIKLISLSITSVAFGEPPFFFARQL
jgi:hypothetical protein